MSISLSTGLKESVVQSDHGSVRCSNDLGLQEWQCRSSQYTSGEYRQLLEQFGMKGLMSRRGNCYDNAPMESFWASLKKEQVHHQSYATRDQAKADIFDYIECFYNAIRRHSALGSRSPLDFTASFASDLTTTTI
jgi:putative transposase